MGYQLVGISGSHKGAAWVVGKSGLLLGRSAEADVVLMDPAVSRRHCRVSEAEGQLEIEDLGSRNPPLVNGIPVREGFIEAKDEIAVGTDVFLIVSPQGVVAPNVDVKSKPSTASWSKGKPVVLRAGSEMAVAENRPRTVEDLVKFHETACRFGRSETMADLLATVVEGLHEQFGPQRLWVARVHGEDGLTFYPAGAQGVGPAVDAPVKTIRKAIKAGRNTLLPQTRRDAGGEEHVFTLIAPVVFGNHVIAVLAVQTGPPDGSYDETDLCLLALLAECLAPFVHAVERTEQLRRDFERLRARTGESQILVGRSRGIRRVRGQVAKAAKTHLPVLIIGETGTGKELVAQSIHAGSTRNHMPLIVVNCAAIPRDLFESQLFGYEKGAFTGADKASPGLLAQAHGGTLFLDEVGDLSLDNQARILRAIEYGAFRRIGAEQETCVDVRVVSATNCELRGAVRQGAFREDLYHRLNGFEIHIPPLRERPSDIPLLAEHFFEMSKEQGKQPLAGLAPEALKYLCSRKWPGNVRELRNCLLRAMSLAETPTVQLKDVLEEDGPLASSPEHAPFSLVEAEKRHIAGVLRQCHGNVPDAAKLLAVSRSTLYRKMSAYDLH